MRARRPDLTAMEAPAPVTPLPVTPFPGWNGRTHAGPRVLHPLAAFEAARGVLGHTAVVGPSQAAELVKAAQHASPSAMAHAAMLDRLGWSPESDPFRPENTEVDHETWAGLLTAYATELRATWRDLRDPAFPDPALPCVDVAGGLVKHVTCTGGTLLQVWLHRGVEIRWDAYRFRPWDMSQSRDLALAALMAAGGGMVHRTVAPLDEGHPRTMTVSTLVGEPDRDARIDAMRRLQAAGLTSAHAAESLRLLGLQIL